MIKDEYISLIVNKKKTKKLGTFAVLLLDMKFRKAMDIQ